MSRETSAPAPAGHSKPTEGGTRFVNGMQLSAMHWMVVAGLVVATHLGMPGLWKRVERFETGPDYRIPYALSKDYWLYARRLERVTPSQVVMVGDSVTWGEYVRPDGTWTHFLNEVSGTPAKFVNAGVNGLFPLAFEGLLGHYAGSLRNQKVILHCNVLWMSSPKADLRTEKEERFNHAALVPQFRPRIPCYKAELNQRLGVVAERSVPFFQWASHLQMAYFDQKNLLAWTLEEDPAVPWRLPNAYRNPLGRITLQVPEEPALDPDRGTQSVRHKPWSLTGEGSTRFDWVELEQSLQWAAFQRLVNQTKQAGNDVFVVVGPFNEHIMAAENRVGFRKLRDGITAWLKESGIAHAVPATLPSPLYADASHPLTEGYRLLATQLNSDAAFQNWLKR